MKKTTYFVLLIVQLFALFIPTNNCLANAAQPGVWNAGGTVFTMLYPEDSSTFKKVQMVEESIYIQLYKGYAVVKGVYQFSNTSSDSLHFKMGYPINGIYSGGEILLNQVQIDELSAFKIKINKDWISVMEKPIEAYGNITNISNNWKIWEISFPPKQSNEVVVYFIVNTNDGVIREGYQSEKHNAFIYLLESGSVWKNPIEKGNFHIQLMDGLTKNDIKGLSNGFNFNYHNAKNTLMGEKKNFSPTPKDNLVVTYSQRITDFKFSTVVIQSEYLFSTIDNWSKQAIENDSYQPVTFPSPYTISKGNSIFTFAIISLGIIVSLILLLIFFRKKRT